MTDRNVRRAGAIGLAVTAALAVLTMTFGGLGIGQRTYELTAEFADGSGIEAGAPVRVAGVRVGSVAGIERDPRGELVRVRLSIDRGTALSDATTASIKLRSMLGAKYVHLEDQAPTRSELAHGGVIPLARTRTSVDLDRFLNTLGEFSEPIDTAAINAFMAGSADALEGHEDSIRTLLDQVAVLAAGLADKSEDLDRLIVSADRLLGAVDSRRGELDSSVEHLGVVFGALAERRADLEGLIDGLASLADTLVPLLDENEAELDSVLTNLVTVSSVLDEQRDRLDLALTQFPLLARRFTGITQDGPWVNVYFTGVLPAPWLANPMRPEGQDGLPYLTVEPPPGGYPDNQQVGPVEARWEDNEQGLPPPDGYPGSTASGEQAGEIDGEESE